MLGGGVGVNGEGGMERFPCMRIALLLISQSLQGDFVILRSPLNLSGLEQERIEELH